MSTTENLISALEKQFQYYKQLGDKTFVQLEDNQLFDRLVKDENSIGIIVHHLAGNMRSRWTDFLTTDGEKDFRNRDEEFEEVINTREELLEDWESGWSCLFNALASVNKENFETLIYIRNIGHTITEAFLRQLAHYSYHIGQIVLLGKQWKGEDWKSLSIPKGQSKIYNQEKFATQKARGHFTDEFLK